jgi:membrane-associated protein
VDDVALPRRGVLIGVAVVVAVVAAIALRFTLDDGDAFTLVESDPALSYLAIFLLIAGDSVIPVFSGEDHAGRASTLAAQGTLSPPPVILAGALGAIVGDSALFWIARRYADRARPRGERAEGNARVAGTLEFLGDST